jgi:hypothetical protein
MVKHSALAYWSCQFAGWALTWGLYNLNRLLGHVAGHQVAMTCVCGFLATHVLRMVMHRYGQRMLPLKNEAIRLTLATFLTATLAAILRVLAIYFFVTHYASLTSLRLLRSSMDCVLLIAPWSLIYWGHRIIIQNRQQSSELRRLHWQLEQMQTRAGELGISMDRLMEEIGRIRPMIDENPARARSEITAFSRLLREGYLE